MPWMKLKIFFCKFPNPWALRVSGMGGYTSKCEKSQNHCTLVVIPQNVKKSQNHCTLLAFSDLRFLYRCLHIEESKGRTPERTREKKEERLMDKEKINLK
jgi:hypothetical protein